MHFYDKAANPRHTYINKDGKECKTGIVRARKEGLFPGVSTVLGVHTEDGLLRYAKEQIIDACWAMPYQCGQDVKEWKREIRKLADAKRHQAADDGSRIHKAMEDYFTGDLTDNNKDMEIVRQASQYLYNHFGDVHWETEKRFVLDFGGGFGGCVDLVSSEGKGIIVDFKTTATGDVKNFKYYDKYLLQLAAYAHGSGLPDADCYIMKISSTHPGVVQLKHYTPEQIRKAFDRFYHLLRFFHLTYLRK